MQFFLRHTIVTIGNKQFDSEKLDVHFNLKSDDNSEPNEGELKIYNLSKQSLSEINKGKNVIINAGYQEDIGTIFLGEVAEVSTKHEGVDNITTITVGDASSEWAKTYVSKSYKADTKASQVLSDVLGQFGLEIGEINVTNDFTYSNGKTISGPVKTIAKQISKDCNLKFHINNGRVYARPYKSGKEIGFLLKSDTGLYGSPQRKEQEDKVLWEVECALNHQITIDTILKIESRTLNGFVRVSKCEYISDDADHMIRMEVEPV